MLLLFKKTMQITVIEKKTSKKKTKKSQEKSRMKPKLSQP